MDNVAKKIYMTQSNLQYTAHLCNHKKKKSDADVTNQVQAHVYNISETHCDRHHHDNRQNFGKINTGRNTKKQSSKIHTSKEHMGIFVVVLYTKAQGC